MKKFKELEYKRPDAEEVKKEFLSCVAQFENAKTAEEANEALLGWTRVMSAYDTQYVIAHVRNNVDLSDEFYDKEMDYFNEVNPTLMPVFKKSSEAMVNSRFRPQLEEIYGKHMFFDAKMQSRLINDSVVGLSVEQNKLCSQYSKTVASCSVEFMGKSCNFYGLLKHMQSKDRDIRKNAFLQWAELYEQVSPTLDDIYIKLVELRKKTAERLGFESYIDYIYPKRGRYDYDAEKTAAFREAVRQYITPLCDKLYREQARRIGVDRLRYYDESFVFPDGNADPEGTPAELVEKARIMYSQMSEQTKEYFDFMTKYELFDLVTKENKRLGGFCTSLPDHKAPFIFSNFNGTAADVDVLTHEAGHAFEYYYASRHLPLDELAHSTSEINEIHSMTMEHFAYPYMESFFGQNADKYRYAHFTEALKTIPYLVSVDEFQHRVFETDTLTPMTLREIWRQTEQKYMPWRDYDGNAFLEEGGFWMQKQHIFMYPFYYIDYALAQIGAFSLYKKQTEGKDAWSDYLTLCSIGGKYGYFETLERAGIPCPLSPQVVKQTAEFAESFADVLGSKIRT